MLSKSNLIVKNLEDWQLVFIEHWFVKYESEMNQEIRSNYDRNKRQLILKNCWLTPEHYPFLKNLAKDLDHSTIISITADASGYEDYIEFSNGELKTYEIDVEQRAEHQQLVEAN